MYLTMKKQLKHLSKQDYQTLRELCRTAKNLTNEAIYKIRQQYFTDGSYLKYTEAYKLLKDSENYKLLNSNMAQQILREVDGSFKSFFGLLKLKQKGTYKEQVRIPHYLPKDGFTTLVIQMFSIKENQLVLPYSLSFKKDHEPVRITIPKPLQDKTIKEIRILPKANARFFEIQYVYLCDDIEQRNLNKQHALALDPGINNLVSGVTSQGKSFIVDGRRLKSINQWYNKQNRRCQRIKDRQCLSKEGTLRQARLASKRNHRVNDYLSKTARKVINYCLANDIGTLVVGHNGDFQRNSSLGKRNNQNFVNIPYAQLNQKFAYLCELYGIDFVVQEESYTSKASFWDKDEMPTWKEQLDVKPQFSGKRIKRGLYRTSDGTTLNADINGALNILRKSKVVSLEGLYRRGNVDVPSRIRIV